MLPQLPGDAHWAASEEADVCHEGLTDGNHGLPTLQEEPLVLQVVHSMALTG